MNVLVAFLWDILVPRTVYVHIRPPSPSSTRARKDLRDQDHNFGKPGLSEELQYRVRKSNLMADLVAYAIFLCRERKVHFTAETARASWFWVPPQSRH